MEGFISNEIGDLEKDIIQLAQDQFPKDTQKFVDAEAKKGKEIAKNIAKTELGKKTGNYLKGIKTGKSGLKDKFSYKVYNESPHGHLIEDGHFNVARGENKNKGGSRRSGANGTKNGFVEGKKIFLKTQVQLESEFSKDVDTFISNLMDKTFK